MGLGRQPMHAADRGGRVAFHDQVSTKRKHRTKIINNPTARRPAARIDRSEAAAAAAHAAARPLLVAAKIVYGVQMPSLDPSCPPTRFWEIQHLLAAAKLIHQARSPRASARDEIGGEMTIPAWSSALLQRREDRSVFGEAAATSVKTSNGTRWKSRSSSSRPPLKPAKEGPSPSSSFASSPNSQATHTRISTRRTHPRPDQLDTQGWGLVPLLQQQQQQQQQPQILASTHQHGPNASFWPLPGKRLAVCC
jgi:hypothetical protein